MMLMVLVILFLLMTVSPAVYYGRPRRAGFYHRRMFGGPYMMGGPGRMINRGPRGPMGPGMGPRGPMGGAHRGPSGHNGGPRH